MIYITGDIHGSLERIIDFCNYAKTTTSDILIILGDTGFNYYNNYKDDFMKTTAVSLPITFFCIRGNHEERPENIDTYEETDFLGGKVYVEECYPNILFAKDGESYNINNKSALCIGGAYSVDKYYRLQKGWHWFKDEQLTHEEMDNIFNSIPINTHYDYVFTHTCPYDTRPIHMFISGLDQSTVDNSMEIWMQSLAEHITFDEWYFGHFHGDWINDKYHMLYKQILNLDTGEIVYGK